MRPERREKGSCRPNLSRGFLSREESEREGKKGGGNDVARELLFKIAENAIPPLTYGLFENEDTLLELEIGGVEKYNVFRNEFCIVFSSSRFLNKFQVIVFSLCGSCLNKLNS